ncbi:hypothetical protein [Streptomyces palmae]|uniref:Lipoprotein n=1 Tax=Streptomyces palmae TaxID=1701085 RepID=A0A4Z0G5T1_9ACTN|nr:hypothetical protein [Streptomyces palmae]TGA90316.1 hypothetical protein E4099_28815 [Streptomyces palmae]
MGARGWSSGRLLLAGTVSAMAFAMAGCGGGGGSEVASAQDGGPGRQGSQGGSSALAEYVDAQRAWVACLREQGLDVPDPDAKGRVDFGDNRAVKSDRKYIRAQERCADLHPTIPDELEQSLQPPLSKAEIEKRRRYARCMQEHGAPDFPDPDAKGHLEQVPWDSTSAGAKRAERSCGPIMGVPRNPPPARG